jgi:hypothetical protein
MSKKTGGGECRPLLVCPVIGRLGVTYRAKASECAELAAKTFDPQSKHMLEKQPSSGRRSLTESKNTKQNLE